MIGFWVKVANKVHIAYWPVTPFAEKQKYAPGAWARVYAPLSLSQTHKNQPAHTLYALYVTHHRGF